MKMPHKNDAADQYHRLGIAHAAVLEADPDTRDLAVAMGEANDAVDKAARDRAVARDVATSRQALRARADFEADRLLRVLDMEALVLSGRDRKKSPYRELFPNGVQAVIAIPLVRQLEKMKTIEEVLAGIPALARYVALVRDARTKLEQAVDLYAEASRAQAQTSAMMELAKVDWRRQYRASYGVLLGRFGDRNRADSYFLDTKGRKPEEEDEPAVPIPSTVDDGPPATAE